MRFLLSGLLAFFLQGCNPPQNDVVIVGNSWLGSMPLYTMTAVDPSVLPENLKTVMLVSDVSVMHMLSSEGVSGAFVTLDNALTVNTHTGGEYCVAMVLDRSSGADAVLAQRDWQWQPGQTLTVGMEDSTIARYMLSHWLQHENIPLTSVKPRILLPTQHLKAFASEEVDVIVTYQPFIERLREAGADVLFDSAQPDVEVVDVLILRNAAWSRAEPAVQQLKTRIWPLALEKLHQRDEKFWQALTELTDTDEMNLTLALEDIHFVGPQEQERALKQLFDQDMPATSNYLIASGMHEFIVPLVRCGSTE